jgi:ABC-2 type transport system ATP-binding protein
MSVEVRNLTRLYHTQRAVSDISFSVNRGEVIGFLGPNGAGKSTTMKMITGYIAPTSGSVNVLGMDVMENALEVRRHIGYLPEHNPLYTELYIHEFLEFSGSLYGMKGSALRKRIRERIDVCGLTPEQNKKIEALSRGYRQRVGLAQALLHDPEVLILDEPTSGLDPNQLTEIRSLIRQVSQNKTVIFSTHIMQEVEAICDRVIVIRAGEIVANDRLSVLMRGTGAPVIIAEFSAPVSPEVFESLPGISQVVKLDECSIKIISTGPDLRQEIFRMAAEKNLPLIGLKNEAQNLEQIFRELTTGNKKDEAGL